MILTSEEDLLYATFPFLRGHSAPISAVFHLTGNHPSIFKLLIQIRLCQQDKQGSPNVFLLRNSLQLLLGCYQRLSRPAGKCTLFPPSGSQYIFRARHLKAQWFLALRFSSGFTPKSSQTAVSSTCKPPTDIDFSPS